MLKSEYNMVGSYRKRLIKFRPYGDARFHPAEDQRHSSDVLHHLNDTKQLKDASLFWVSVHTDEDRRGLAGTSAIVTVKCCTGPKLKMQVLRYYLHVSSRRQSAINRAIRPCLSRSEVSNPEAHTISLWCLLPRLLTATNPKAHASALRTGK